IHPVTGTLITLSSSHRKSLCPPPLHFICALRSSPSLLWTLLLQLGFVTPILCRYRLSKGTAITSNNSFGGQLNSRFCIPFGAHAATFGGVSYLCLY
ncbi:unnamed protein product, partial [Prunus brigantina]